MKEISNYFHLSFFIYLTKRQVKWYRCLWLELTPSTNKEKKMTNNDKNIFLLFDNDFVTNLKSLIEDNKDAVPFTDEELQTLRNLKLGEITFIGFIELKRVSQ